MCVAAEIVSLRYLMNRPNRQIQNTHVCIPNTLAFLCTRLTPITRVRFTIPT